MYLMKIDSLSKFLLSMTLVKIHTNQSRDKTKSDNSLLLGVFLSVDDGICIA